MMDDQVDDEAYEKIQEARARVERIRAAAKKVKEPKKKKSKEGGGGGMGLGLLFGGVSCIMHSIVLNELKFLQRTYSII